MSRARVLLDVVLNAVIGRMAFALAVALVIGFAADASEGESFSLSRVIDGGIGGLIAGAIQWGATREAVRRLTDDVRVVKVEVSDHIAAHAEGRFK